MRPPATAWTRRPAIQSDHVVATTDDTAAIDSGSGSGSGVDRVVDNAGGASTGKKSKGPKESKSSKKSKTSKSGTKTGSGKSGKSGKSGRFSSTTPAQASAIGSTVVGLALIVGVAAVTVTRRRHRSYNKIEDDANANDMDYAIPDERTRLLP